MHAFLVPAVPYTKHAVFPCSPPANSTEVKLMLWFRGFVNSSLLHTGDLLFVTEASGRVHRTPSARFDMAVNTTSYRSAHSAGSLYKKKFEYFIHPEKILKLALNSIKKLSHTCILLTFLVILAEIQSNLSHLGQY